ncbi:MAG: SDR family NAD(P)-dependent oxidoreductase [Proteobacteria bacterium]|nr:SDR family NAD(P)-dependent oxidoreductase [Pseudomonadota bacterium]
MRSVVITGAFTGIGRDCATYLNERGWRVFAGTKEASEAEAWAAEAPSGLIPLPLDVTNAESIAAARARVDEALAGAPLDGLVNNAAIAIGGPLEYLPVEDVQAVFDVNVFGPQRASAEFLPLIRRGPGRLVHIGSSAGGFATPLMGPYCASKAALEAFADAQRRELAAWDIWVALVAPGPVDTGIWDQDVLERTPEAAREHYAAMIDGFREVSRSNRGRVIPPRTVSVAIEHALTARRPRLRYDPGLHAKLARAVLHKLPGRAADKLLRRMMARPEEP